MLVADAESESNGKLSNIPDESRTKGDSAECSEPSDCKIPKTDSGDSCEKEPETPSEIIDVKVVYNKNKYDVNCPINTTVAAFKKQLQALLGTQHKT